MSGSTIPVAPKRPVPSSYSSKGDRVSSRGVPAYRVLRSHAIIVIVDDSDLAVPVLGARQGRGRLVGVAVGQCDAAGERQADPGGECKIPFFRITDEFQDEPTTSRSTVRAMRRNGGRRTESVHASISHGM